MRSKFALIIAFVMVLTTICESKDFCRAFLDNGNKVDFVFRRMLVDRKFKSEFTDPNTLEYFYARILLDGKLNQTISVDLVIGGQFWRLIMDDPRNGLRMYFENNRYEGRDATFFNGHRMGADIPDVNQDFSKSAAVLFKKQSSKVTFGNIPEDNHINETDLNRYQEFKTGFVSTLELPDIALDFAFAPLFPPKELIAIDFATKTQINGGNGLKLTRLGIHGGLSGMATRFFRLEIPSTNYTIFQTFNTKYDIIGVHSMPDSFLDWTLFILFNDDRRVLFCMSLHDHISDYCRFPVELIDCYDYTNPVDTTKGGEPDNPPLTKTPPRGPDFPEEGGSGSSNRNNVWIWIFFIFLIIVFIVAIILIVWYFMKRTEESQTLSNKKAQNQSPERTSLSTPPRTQPPKSGIEPDSGANAPKQDTPQGSGTAVEQKPTGTPTTQKSGPEPESGSNIRSTM